MRRSVVVLAALAVLATVLVGGPSLFTPTTTSEILPETEPDPGAEMVRPAGGESGFWPYLNSRTAFEKRSPINVVVIGEADDVIRLLVEARQSDWEETDVGQEEASRETHTIVDANGSARNDTGIGDDPAFGGTEIGWSRRTGATRYAYVDPGGDEPGRWVEETAQVHDGTYYGHRYHIRLYECPNPDEPWVAMQTHHEHFDWFTLRHRVDGSQAAQARLEADLMDLPRIDIREDVRRVYIDNRNASDADGWATFVDLSEIAIAGFGAVSMAVGGRRRIVRSIDDRIPEPERRRIAAVRERAGLALPLLAVTIVGIVLGVRLGGIALERAGILTMHGIAGLLYPIVGLGLPIVTYLIARRIEHRLDAAIVAGGSLAVAVWLDYALLGVHAVPIDVIVQRMFVVVSLGMIAAGAARRAARRSRWNGLLVAGAALWLLLLAGTLLGYL